jgi:hypothetical protein
LASALLNFLDDDELSADEGPVERSDDEDNADALDIFADVLQDVPTKRSRPKNSEDVKDWHPWPSKLVFVVALHQNTRFADHFIKACTIDILMHLPRSVFSHRQLDLLRWLLEVNGIDDVPSTTSMQNLNVILQKLHGIRTIPYDGAMGHRYYVNSLADIIAQVSCFVSILVFPADLNLI